MGSAAYRDFRNSAKFVVFGWTEPRLGSWASLCAWERIMPPVIAHLYSRCTALTRHSGDLQRVKSISPTVGELPSIPSPGLCGHPLRAPIVPAKSATSGVFAADPAKRIYLNQVPTRQRFVFQAVVANGSRHLLVTEADHHPPSEGPSRRTM